MKFIALVLVAALVVACYYLGKVCIRFVRRIRLVRHYKKKVNELLEQTKGEKDDSAVS